MPATVTPIDAISPFSDQRREFTGLDATAVEIRATSGKLHAFFLDNTSGTETVFFKFWDSATSPTVGTDVPFLQIRVEAAKTAKAALAHAAGIALANGLWMAAVTGKASTDNTNPAVGPDGWVAVGA